MTKLHNPFQFGKPVKGEFYFPRKELSTVVENFLDGRIHVVLMGPRRFGKTSFVLNLLKSQEAKKKTCLYLDIFNITSHRDFLQQLLRGLREKKGLWQNFIDKVKTVKPQLSIDLGQGDSNVNLSLDASSGKDVKELIQDVLAELHTLGDEVIVVIDEFQKVAEINDDHWLEATLRSYMQSLSNTSFLFTGSRKSLISDMMHNSARPFYRSGQIIEFPALGPEFTNWIIERFKEVDIQADSGAIDHLRAMVQDTPNYVQMACFHLVANGVENIDKRDVDIILETIVKQNAYAYQTLLNTLTLPQQRALRLCAKESEQIYAKDLRQKYEIPTGAALASAVNALKEKQIIDESAAKGRVQFDDPLFAIWLKTEFPD